MADYGESKSQDKRLRAQGKPETVSDTQTFEEFELAHKHFSTDELHGAKIVFLARQAEVDGALSATRIMQDMLAAANERIQALESKLSDLEDIDKVCDFQREGIEKMQAGIDRLESSRDAAVAEAFARGFVAEHANCCTDCRTALRFCRRAIDLQNTLESLQQKAKP